VQDQNYICKTSIITFTESTTAEPHVNFFQKNYLNVF